MPVFSSLSDAIERAKTANLQEDDILKMSTSVSRASQVKCCPSARAKLSQDLQLVTGPHTMGLIPPYFPVPSVLRLCYTPRTTGISGALA